MIDQEYCIHDYWLDYPRKDRVKINDLILLTDDEKSRLRKGEMIAKPDRGGSYTQYYKPMFWDRM